MSIQTIRNLLLAFALALSFHLTGTAAANDQQTSSVSAVEKDGDKEKEGDDKDEEKEGDKKGKKEKKGKKDKKGDKEKDGEKEDDDKDEKK